MAKAIITIEDKAEPGEMNLSLEFDPPAEKDQPATMAQLTAMGLFEGAMKAVAEIKHDQE